MQSSLYSPGKSISFQEQTFKISEEQYAYQAFASQGTTGSLHNLPGEKTTGCPKKVLHLINNRKPFVRFLKFLLFLIRVT